ncbi:hypothetical protein F3Y22_tig00112231pilonHSYRG00092 [Hibiscus syriacus]|uniref:Uncharacterized protein n=1 Tax=Hibiscus syriacus TaxID=106335 RepID=A0A6A2YCN5_HIBSY|nr:hypothetical protein F3Y22_tig00112231pilonHSYRG00092 [Hibiscus syriacus]
MNLLMRAASPSMIILPSSMSWFLKAQNTPRRKKSLESRRKKQERTFAAPKIVQYLVGKEVDHDEEGDYLRGESVVKKEEEEQPRRGGEGDYLVARPAVVNVVTAGEEENGGGGEESAYDGEKDKIGIWIGDIFNRVGFFRKLYAHPEAKLYMLQLKHQQWRLFAFDRH